MEKDSMSTNYQTLLFEKRGVVGIVTINRPEKLNALNSVVLSELKTLMKEIEVSNADFHLRALILTGAGEKAFVAGADIKEMQGMSEKEAYFFSKLGQDVTLLFETISIPIIACVNGFAFGGGLEMAMGCDFILALESAVVGQPEVKLGLIPGYGGTQRLAKRIGVGKARELLYTGRNMKAAEALSLGLFNEILPTKEALLERAIAIGNEIALVAPLAVRAAKRALHQGFSESIEKGLDIEAVAFGSIFNSEDYKEGTAAFLEKRKATFKGR